MTIFEHFHKFVYLSLLDVFEETLVSFNDQLAYLFLLFVALHLLLGFLLNFLHVCLADHIDAAYIFQIANVANFFGKGLRHDQQLDFQLMS